MATQAHVDLRDVNKIRMTCEQATINNLTLDLDMMKPSDREKSAQTDSKPLLASEHTEDGKYHLLLAASGSVATIKIPNIIRGLAKHQNLSIRIMLTESAAKFLQGQSDEQPSLEKLSNFPNVDAIYRDEDEWKVPWTRGAPILHIELRRWADLLVIAPLSANTLAKISNGMADNLLTSVIRAWEVLPFSDDSGSNDDSSTEDLGQDSGTGQRRIIVAPAMNTAMWRHPLTAAQLRGPQQQRLYHWFDVMNPIEKELACGDTGDGAMCDWNHIVSAIGVHIEMHKLRL